MKNFTNNFIRSGSVTERNISSKYAMAAICDAWFAWKLFPLNICNWTLETLAMCNLLQFAFGWARHFIFFLLSPLQFETFDEKRERLHVVFFCLLLSVTFGSRRNFVPLPTSTPHRLVGWMHTDEWLINSWMNSKCNWVDNSNRDDFMYRNGWEWKVWNE